MPFVRDSKCSKHIMVTKVGASVVDAYMGDIDKAASQTLCYRTGLSC